MPPDNGFLSLKGFVSPNSFEKFELALCCPAFIFVIENDSWPYWEKCLL
jgi:hypothetical protein